MMTRTEYEAAICKLLPDAGVVPCKTVQGNGWSPKPGCCHCNVDRWVAENPGHAPVRGWVFLKLCVVNGKMGRELTAHSVVLHVESGYVFDITPIHDDLVRPSMVFAPHIVDSLSFLELRKSNPSIYCPDCD